MRRSNWRFLPAQCVGPLKALYLLKGCVSYILASVVVPTALEASLGVQLVCCVKCSSTLGICRGCIPASLRRWPTHSDIRRSRMSRIYAYRTFLHRCKQNASSVSAYLNLES
ncbi:hypothetical protein BC939DRAFT_251443 [Gamsiella multidivaricata]|uniref:uncharacterized protein n=1 Tax=Gamsiella multidivaricata TaxID=101098 RepID=UPI002220E8A7|nr:uncharacterized protein BC939DRAFT_251443 [Gamsiella multidivaricata]KAI7819721.1 hypothetical protein BC939DRAFT_251443 [Gamsiella multidivaricata]